MNPVSNEERDRIFKEAFSESDTFIKSKEFDKAFKSISRANLYLPYYSNDPFMYLFNLMNIKEKQAEICIKEKSPKYDFYLIYSLESFALEIARDLMGFPILSGFNYRKEKQFSPYYEDGGCNCLEVCPDEDDDLFISLKKLKIFQWREEFFKEYLDFLYNELPKIYCIPSDFNERTRKESERWDVEVRFSRFFVIPEELKKQSIGTIPYEVNKFITNLLKKYYDMGNL
jgi:hypothetical protein